MPKIKSLKTLEKPMSGSPGRRGAQTRKRPVPQHEQGSATARSNKGTATHTRPTENAVGGPPASVLPFPVVGIGASAGGLEPLSQLLHRLPAVTGMSLVVVLHLDPSHQSRLPEILSRISQMPVQEIKPAQAVQPDHIYVLPPMPA